MNRKRETVNAIKMTGAISPQIMNLSTLLRRSASISYRRTLGLSNTEWRVLGLLGERRPLLQQEVVEVLGQDKGQTSRVVSKLFEAGLITRQKAADGVLIDFDHRGRTLFNSMRAQMRQRNAKLLHGLDENEREILVRALRRITENAKQLLESAQERSDTKPRQKAP